MTSDERLTAPVACLRGRTMFERSTDRARRVVVLAQEEARMLGHTWIGTELRALLRQHGIDPQGSLLKVEG